MSKTHDYRGFTIETLEDGSFKTLWLENGGQVKSFTTTRERQMEGYIDDLIEEGLPPLKPVLKAEEKRRPDLGSFEFKLMVKVSAEHFPTAEAIEEAAANLGDGGDPDNYMACYLAVAKLTEALSVVAGVESVEAEFLGA